jgi:hypothetical protein
VSFLSHRRERNPGESAYQVPAVPVPLAVFVVGVALAMSRIPLIEVSSATRNIKAGRESSARGTRLLGVFHAAGGIL